MSTQSLTSYISPGDIPANFWNTDLKYAVQTGADPYLLAAIGRQETDYGTLGAGRMGFSLGYGYYGPNNFDIQYMDAPGQFDQQLYSAGLKVHSYFGNNPVTYDSLLKFAQTQWKPGDPTTWANNVWSFYNSYNKDPSVPGNHTPSLSDKTPPIPEDSLLGLLTGKDNGTIAYFVIMILLVVLGIFALSKILTSKGDTNVSS